MADLFSVVGIGGAVMLIIACWLEARGRQGHPSRREADLGGGSAIATEQAPHQAGG